MQTYVIREKDFTGAELGRVEAETPDAAATKFAREVLPHPGQRTHTVAAERVSGDRGKGGCFRLSSPGPQPNNGERALGRQIHVQGI